MIPPFCPTDFSHRLGPTPTRLPPPIPPPLPSLSKNPKFSNSLKFSFLKRQNDSPHSSDSNAFLTLCNRCCSDLAAASLPDCLSGSSRFQYPHHQLRSRTTMRSIGEESSTSSPHHSRIQLSLTLTHTTGTNELSDHRFTSVAAAPPHHLPTT